MREQQQDELSRGVEERGACLTNGNGLLHGEEEQRGGKGAASAYCA